MVLLDMQVVLYVLSHTHIPEVTVEGRPARLANVDGHLSGICWGGPGAIQYGF